MPNTLVQLSFKLKYPLAKVIIWKQIDVFKWHVNFETKGKGYLSLYTSEGAWLETACSVTMKDVPKKVQDSFGSRYGRKGLKHIYRIKTPNQVIFEILWSNGIYDVKLLYSETGTIVGKLIC
ncbi:MAG: hypothetical protein ACJART_000149 [Maribacter sp.]|jgi:hypothetical protein